MYTQARARYQVGRRVIFRWAKAFRQYESRNGALIRPIEWSREKQIFLDISQTAVVRQSRSGQATDGARPGTHADPEDRGVRALPFHPRDARPGLWFYVGGE